MRVCHVRGHAAFVDGAVMEFRARTEAWQLGVAGVLGCRGGGRGLVCARAAGRTAGGPAHVGALCV